MKRIYIIALLITLSLITFIVYSNVIYGEFQFDDEKIIAENLLIKDPGRLFKLGFLESLINSGRPVTDMTFALNYYYGKLDVKGYHLFNIFLHICVSVLVYFFIKKTIVLSNLEYPLSPEIISIMVSAIFALHPINTQAVSYIVQRSEILSSFFYLTALLLFIKSVEQNSFSKKSILYLSAFLSSIFAVGSKTTAISLPFVLLVYDYYFLKDRKFLDRIKLSGFLIMSGLIFSIVYLSKVSNSQNIGFHIKEITPFQYLLTQFSVILTYMRLLIFPVSQNLDYDYPVSTSLFEISTLLPILFVLSFLFISFIFRKKERLLSFSAFWFFLTLLPSSSIVPLPDVIFEHRIYLASSGFFLLISLLSIKIIAVLTDKYGVKVRNVVVSVIVFAVILSLSVSTIKRNEIWKDRIALWKDVVSKSPGKARAHFNLGHALLEKGLYIDAIRELETALRCKDDGSVNRADIFREMGAVLFKMGRINEAVSIYREGLKLSPGHIEILNNLSIALLEKGMADEALPYAEMALKAAPLNGDVHNTTGEIHFAKGEYSQAAEHFIKAIGLNPDIPLRYWNAAISLEKLGKIKEALSYMDIYISIEKNEPDRKEAMTYIENLRKKSSHQ